MTIFFFEQLPEYPPPEWLVENLIPARGVTLIAGAPKCGKSFFVHEIISAIINGRFVAKKFPAKLGKVLLIDLENDGGLLKLRLKGFGEIPGESLAVLTEWNNSMDKLELNAHELFKWVEDHQPCLIVIDTFRRFFGHDENSSELVNDFFLSTLQPLSKDRAVILVHHSKKKTFGKKGLDLDDIRGSTDIAGFAAHILILQKIYDGGIKISSESRQAKEMNPFSVMLLAENEKFSFSYNAEHSEDLSDLADAVSTLREIIQAKFENGSFVKTKQLIDAMAEKSYSKDSAAKAIQQIRNDGLVWIRRGQYQVFYGDRKLTSFE